MLRMLRYSFYAVLVSTLVIGIQAFAAGASAPSKAPAARPVGKPRASMSAKVPRTPYERIFAPGVARSLKAGDGGNQTKGAQPAMRAAATEPTANFAGYPGGLLYTACGADLFGTGLCAASQILTADFNRDGKQDIAYLTVFGTIDVLFGDGHGAFAAPVETLGPPGETGTISSAVVADMNGDG